MENQDWKAQAQKMFLEACEGWTVKFCTKYKNQDKVFLIVADGQSMTGIPFKVSFDKMGWLVESMDIA